MSDSKELFIDASRDEVFQYLKNALPSDVFTSLKIQAAEVSSLPETDKTRGIELVPSAAIVSFAFSAIAGGVTYDFSKAAIIMAKDALVSKFGENAVIDSLDV